MPKAQKREKQRKKSGNKLEALIRTQHINDFLSKTITESEALQNSGDDRPVYESHVTDLLDDKKSITTRPVAKQSTSVRKPGKQQKARPKKRR